MTSVPGAEIEKRVDTVQGMLRDRSIDAIVVVQKADLFYLTGTTQDAHLLVPAEGEPRLLVRKVLERAQAESGIGDVRPMRSLKDLPGQIDEVCGERPTRLGFELDVLTVQQFRGYERLLGNDVELIDGSPPILAARSVKSDWEIDQLRDAAEIHRRLFAEVPEFLAVAESTFELQARLEARCGELGHCGIIRMRGLDVTCSIGVVVSGEDGAIPSHSMFPIGGKGSHPYVACGGSRSPIEPDTPIILDYLMSTTGYHADCTRMAIRGEVPDRAAQIYSDLLTLLRSVERELKPGAIPSEIYSTIVEQAGELGLEEGFMGPEGYKVRFIGHSVGLEVNEAPVIAPRFDEPLVAGNTLAIEPKFTHPQWGVIGIENTYAITDSGAENLTPFDDSFIGS